MATVTVKNIPDELYERLKSIAEINRRSINSEIIVSIENAVSTRKIDMDAFIENARKLRRLTEKHPINEPSFGIGFIISNLFRISSARKFGFRFRVSDISNLYFPYPYT